MSEPPLHPKPPAPDGLPRHHAIILGAATILVMALSSGKNDPTRGPLWHALWIGSAIVVLASLAGSAARRLSRR